MRHILKGPSAFLNYILPNLKKMSIRPKLPLSTYEMLENAGELDSFDSHQVDVSVSTWANIWSFIGYLGKLKRLRIWPDHTDTDSWSVVNERAVLSPLTTLRNNPNLDLLIDLPKLHPKWETTNRHFVDSHSPLTIHRRYRQRYHGIEQSDSTVRGKHVPDFPITYEIADFVGDALAKKRVEEED